MKIGWATVNLPATGFIPVVLGILHYSNYGVAEVAKTFGTPVFAGKTETLREFRYEKIRYVHAIRGKLSGDSTKQPASALPLTD